MAESTRKVRTDFYAKIARILTPEELSAVLMVGECGNVKMAAMRLGKSEGAIRKLRCTARAKLRKAGYELPDRRRLTGAKRVWVWHSPQGLHG